MKRKAFKAAFPHTIPILTGFLFLGIAYGLYMKSSGFPFYYPILTSILIFGGSLEFVAVEMLLSPFAPLAGLIMAFLIQARHLFYGLSMLERYRNMGWKKFYLIFGLCDETFSVNCSVDIPEGVDRGWFYFFVTLLNQSYWVLSVSLGALFGSLISFDTEGISFVMTAMFAVIFLEQWLKEEIHTSSLIGLGVSCLCLYFFGADSFLLPAMGGILLLLTLLRTPLSGKEKKS